MPIRDYTPHPSMHQPTEATRAFPIVVTRVDPDAPSLSVRDLNTGIVYDHVAQFPAEGSSMETTSVLLPEIGQSGIAVFLQNYGGYVQVAVITWTLSNIRSNVDGIAHRASQTLGGYSTRYRGVHRKPYPGQRSRTLSAGLHVMEGAGWERMAADGSQDMLDPHRREWTQATGRRVVYTDAGIVLEGAVQRPGAATSEVPPEVLPDGSLRQVVQLQPGMAAQERYLTGVSDVLPLAEVLERVQEFSLDFPIPQEILESGMLESLLGTRESLWDRTSIETQEGIQRDDQSYLADQGVDHPTDPTAPDLQGPTTQEGPTPRRRGWIMERAAGTLVGYNPWDPSTYGHPLKPVLWPRTRTGRFGTDVESGYQRVVPSTDHVETRLAASTYMMRFPSEANTTRLDITKEGQVLLEIGATIPLENIQWDAGTYEHPWGAGRSLEAHLVGSAKVVLGKNRDEEESLDLTTLGQVVMRLGADDASLPYVGRTVSTQIREKSDAVLGRSLQAWAAPRLTPGDAGNLENKTGAENVSVRAALDGGTFLRLGARNAAAKRRHIKNGYSDAQGRVQDAPGEGSRARTKGRPVYGAGDSTYRFNDLRTAGKPTNPRIAPYFWSGDPVKDMDAHGLSLDVHAVRDIFLRVGKNKLMDQSILIDVEGGVVGIIGKDQMGRSLTSTLQGGVEMTIGSNSAKRAVQLMIIGDVNWAIQGNWHVHSTGSIVFDADKSIHSIAHEENIMKGVNIRQTALVQHVSEAPDVVHHQGAHPI